MTLAITRQGAVDVVILYINVYFGGIMTRIVSAIISISLMLCNMISVGAIGIQEDIDTDIVVNEKYQFLYTEKKCDDHSIIREYNKSKNNALSYGNKTRNTASDNEMNYCRNVLRSLGKNQCFIDQLSIEDIEGYLQSEYIVSVESYMKVDDTGTRANVSKEEALAAAVVDPGFTPTQPNPEGSGYKDGAYYTSTDDYMRIMYIISYLGNGRYKFSIDAEWLNDPFFRFKDSLGACAQNIAIENDTRSGWYMYDNIMLINSNYTERRDVKIVLTNFQNAEGLGNWDGSGVVFDLADDSYLDLANYSYFNNHRIHYEFEGTIHQWQMETNFNTTAMYTHTQIAVNFSLTLSISTEGTGVGIGIEPVGANKKYFVELDSSIKHIP